MPAVAPGPRGSTFTALVAMRYSLAALRTEAPQMRENMSLLSFWGLVFSLIAVTLFVVIYSYQKSKSNRNIVEDLRQRSVKIYLAAETREAETDSKKFRRAETSILFWLIIAMNAAVIIIFTLAYRIL
jgi:cbb3-type cytochrome oxidase subunit 1